MKTIKNPIIVEGLSDRNKILSMFNCVVFMTNGYSIDEDTINILNLCKEKTIVLTDSDEAGKQIRQRLNSLVNKTINVEVPINSCNKRGKHGVAECDINVLRNALEPFVCGDKEIKRFSSVDYNQTNKESLSKLLMKYNLITKSKKFQIEVINLLKLTKNDIENGNY